VNIDDRRTAYAISQTECSNVWLIPCTFTFKSYYFKQRHYFYFSIIHYLY